MKIWEVKCYWKSRNVIWSKQFETEDEAYNKVARDNAQHINMRFRYVVEEKEV